MYTLYVLACICVCVCVCVCVYIYIYIFVVGAKEFPLLQNVHIGFGAHPEFFSRVKRPGREVNHSPSSAEVKNKWSCTLLLLYAFMAWTGKNFYFVTMYEYHSLLLCIRSVRMLVL